MRDWLGICQWFDYGDHERVQATRYLLRELQIRHLKTNTIIAAEKQHPGQREWHVWVASTLAEFEIFPSVRHPLLELSSLFQDSMGNDLPCTLEAGFPAPDYDSEPDQMQKLLELPKRRPSRGRRMYWHTLFDSPRSMHPGSSAANAEGPSSHTLGLITADGRRKLGFFAMKAIMRY